jgi:hypothetical protein
MRHRFLSAEWLEAVAQLRKDQPEFISTGPQLRMNVKISGHPFGAAPLRLHLDNAQGRLLFGSGALEGPDLVLSTTYDIAWDLFLEQEPEGVMEAFMIGDIMLQGDVVKLIAAFARQDASTQTLDLMDKVVGVTDLNPEAP